ncbi:hypothetical protein GQ600_637 [Phytophthora cactorum]|nr:hypothetical protein GQ600_637 [Phytophthora cactorum]
MDSTDIEQYVSFAAEDCVLQLEASHRYCTVHATKERRQGESGKWMFEVTVDVFGGDGESLLIGWEVPRHSTSSTTVATSLNNPHSSSGNKDHVDVDSSSMVPGISPSDDGRSFGVTWQSDGGLDMGMLHANGYPNQGCPASELEILLAVRLTRSAVPQLRFYLNGDLTLPLRRTTNSGGVAGLLNLILVILLAPLGLQSRTQHIDWSCGLNVLVEQEASDASYL